MTKFVCDFDAINNTIEKMNTQVSEMNQELSSLSTNINSSTNGWSGNAKNNFISSNLCQIEIIKRKISHINDLSNFIKNATSQIESTDAELALLTI